MPLFVIEYITIERVSTPEPAVKKLTTKSSIDIVKASRACDYSGADFGDYYSAERIEEAGAEVFGGFKYMRV
jgi:hypothetical protein